MIKAGRLAPAQGDKREPYPLAAGCMIDAEREAVLSEVADWLRHPEAGDYRMLKLRLLLDKGYVALHEAVTLWEDRHKGP